MAQDRTTKAIASSSLSVWVETFFMDSLDVMMYCENGRCDVKKKVCIS